MFLFFWGGGLNKILFYYFICGARNAFDEDRVPALVEDEAIRQDIHAVSSLLKMYFRELPNPLCTYQLYDQFVNAVQGPEDLRVLRMREVIIIIMMIIEKPKQYSRDRGRNFAAGKARLACDMKREKKEALIDGFSSSSFLHSISMLVLCLYLGCTTTSAAALPHARVLDPALGSCGPAQCQHGHDCEKCGHCMGAESAALQGARVRRCRSTSGEAFHIATEPKCILMANILFFFLLHHKPKKKGCRSSSCRDRVPGALRGAHIQR